MGQTQCPFGDPKTFGGTSWHSHTKAVHLLVLTRTIASRMGTVKRWPETRETPEAKKHCSQGPKITMTINHRGPLKKKLIKKGVLVCNVNVLNLDIFGLHLGTPQSQALSHSSLGKRCASFWAPKVEIKNRDDRFDKGSNDKGSNTAVGQNLGYPFGDGKTQWIFSTFKDYVPW